MLSGRGGSPTMDNAQSKRVVKREKANVSVLGKDFDLDESEGAPPVSQQIATALRANAGKVLDFFRDVRAIHTLPPASLSFARAPHASRQPHSRVRACALCHTYRPPRRSSTRAATVPSTRRSSAPR